MNYKDKISEILDDMPPLIDMVDKAMNIAQIGSAIIVVILFIIGVADLAFLIYESFQSGRISSVQNVIDLIDFVLLLFIVVEAYRTISAYIRSKNPMYVLNIVVFAGVIAIVRKIIVFRPEQLSETGTLYTAVAYAVILLSLGVLVQIMDIQDYPGSGSKQ